MTTNHQLPIAILGAGHGGVSLAAHLAQQGHRVALWNRSPKHIAEIASLGGIHLSRPGAETALARLAVVTSDMRVALAGAQLILVCVPASGHADVAAACAPHLRDGQSVLLLPGRTGGALEFECTLREHGCEARILLGEANTFPFAARRVDANEAHIYGVKAVIHAAALPALRTPELVSLWRQVLPMLRPAPSVVHTGIANVGAILHPVITLRNAVRIERGESFDFYTEGVTARVAEALAIADAERLRVGYAYGVSVKSLPAWIASTYGHRSNTMQGALAGNPAYVGIKAPNTLDHRYLLEDVPTGLIPMLELGEAAGLHLPMLSSLVDQARISLGGEPWERTRTLASLGLEGLDADAICDYVEKGVVPARPARRALQWSRTANLLAGLKLTS